MPLWDLGLPCFFFCECALQNQHQVGSRVKFWRTHMRFWHSQTWTHSEFGWEVELPPKIKSPFYNLFYWSWTFLSLLVVLPIHLTNGITSRLWNKEPNDWDSLENGIERLSYQQIWMSGRDSHQFENVRPVTSQKFQVVLQNQNCAPVSRLGKGQPRHGVSLQHSHFVWGFCSLRSCQTHCFSTSIQF